MKNNNLPKQQKLQRQKTARTLVIAACSLLICNCDLFNKPVDPDYIKKIDAEIAYANAPWVPIEIDNGGLGTSVPEQGSHAKTVKYRYSFVLRFQPARDYPFSGWQAWHADEEPFAVWRPGQPPSESGADKVRFMPINADGTEVEVFVYVKPSAGKLIIGPWGAHIPDLNVTLDDGLLGTMFPAAISGVKKGYPFNLSFRPDPQFPFRGWQLQFGDDEGTESFYSTADGKIIGEESDGNVRWIPLNMTGNEMSITIENLPSHNITIKPIDADSALTEVRTLSDSRWGTSFPVSGTVQTRRQGFSFSVEFTPLTGWVFRGWKAYAFSGQNAGSLNPNTLGEELPEEKVKIEQISGKASITVLNVDGPVLLVPLCVQQLRVTLTSPPLFSAISYPRSQQVRIEFSTALNPATAVFGKDSIQITDSNNDPCYSYFNDPSYNETDNSITLIPKAANLPPENRVITVIAGTAIESEFGETLSEPVTITYSTNNEKIEKAYQAGNIWAIHDPLSEDQFGSFDGTQFFNQRENFDRDRRLRKNTGGSYEITLYFGVTRSTEEIVSPSLITNYSQYIEIAEINYATLSGNEIDGLGKPAEFAPGSRTVEITEMENNANTAGLFYRNGNAPHPALGTSYYKAVYTWNEPPANGGIIRLAVLPRYDGTGPEDPDRVEAESWETLVAAGRGFVTAVFDNSPPGGDASIELGGAASLSGKVYNYNETSAFMSIAANFVNITDNYIKENNGISQRNATANRPWTMDDQSAMQWQFRIVTGGLSNYEYDGWLGLNEVPPSPLNLADVFPDENKTDTRNLQVRFRDSLGNISLNDEGWVDAAQFIYYTPAIAAVNNWSASYDPVAASVTVSWTRPETDKETLPVEVSLDGGTTWSKPTAETSHTITGVPVINTDNIKNGRPTENVTGYAVLLRAYNGDIRQNEPPLEARIWNIPGMALTHANTVLLNQDNINTALAAAGSSGKNFVLTENVSLDSWMPVGNGTAAFQGKFYGNGHTITVSNGYTVDGIYAGLFGYINNALIQDFCIEFAGLGFTDSDTAQYFGGIAGYAAGSSEICNIIVQGTLKAKLSTDSDKSLGGLVSYIEIGTTSATKIINCLVEAELNFTTSGSTVDSPTVYFGGITGQIGPIPDQQVNLSTGERISAVEVSGDLNLTMDTSTILYGGGIVGSSNNAGTLRDLRYSGTLTITKKETNTVLMENNIGGLCGYLRESIISDSAFDGIIVFSAPDTTGLSNLGGVVGYCSVSSTVINTISKGNINVSETGNSGIRMGGVAGYIYGSSGTGNASILNCSYGEGSITVTSTSSSNKDYESISVGGVIGYIARYAIVKNSYSGIGEIKACVSSNNSFPIFIGGFAGEMWQANIESCYSNTKVFIPEENEGTGSVLIGGFSGRITSSSGYPCTLSYCYATGEVNVLQTMGPITAGGFIGLAQLYVLNDYYGVNRITRCFATGNVNVYSNRSVTTGGLVGQAYSTEINESWASGAVYTKKTNTASSTITTGGLVGSLGSSVSSSSMQEASINNCYALGNVMADSAGGGAASRVGGLVGLMQTSATRAIQRSFSAGTVTYQNSGSGTLYVGGIVGLINSGLLNNNAALCPSVTAKGSSSRNIARVYPYPLAIPGDNSIKANYAKENMRIEKSNAYGTIFFPYWDKLTPSTEPVTCYFYADSANAADLHGANTTDSAFHSQNFWTANLTLNSNGSYETETGPPWDFSNVVTDGFPRLKFK